MNKIGANIRKIREQLGLSQDNLAIELGITQPSYARLEKGDSKISIARLIHIATILKISVTELIDVENCKIVISQNDEKSKEYVNSLLQADKEHIQTLKDEIFFLRKLLNQDKY